MNSNERSRTNPGQGAPKRHPDFALKGNLRILCFAGSGANRFVEREEMALLIFLTVGSVALRRKLFTRAKCPMTQLISPVNHSL